VDFVQHRNGKAFSVAGGRGLSVLFSCSALVTSAACSADDAPETAAAPLESASPDAGSLEPLPEAGPIEAGPAFLAQKYADRFPIGAAVDPVSIQTHADLLGQHFSSVTPENDMKFESLQRTEGVFTFAAADAIVEFAESHDMMVRGHALVWHRQTPAWMFTDAAGGPASEELLFTRLRNHISTVVGHFKGRVDAWDVVNEAFMDDGAYRTAEEERDDQKSAWYGVAQERYIAEAFRAAHDADPDAKLFYNDYYNYLPAKRQAIYEMLRQLLADGVPVHGVGLQAHLSIEPSPVETSHGYYQTIAEEEAAIELYSSLGLEVHITELDMSLYIPGIMYTPDTFYTAATFSDELKAKQAARYGEFFALFRKHSDVITNVTFWGVADDNTWLSEFSSGRKDFPLLFDDAHQPKEAFEAVTGF
jgi:endo-1,4-beta-xylanase